MTTIDTTTHSLFHRITRRAAGATLALALALPATAFAQNPDAGTPSAQRGDHHRGGRAERGRRGHHGHRGHHGAGHIMRELNLSDAQRAELRTIRQEAHTEAERLRAQPASDARREQMRALHERTRERMHAVLTPEQRAEAQRLRREARAERVERRVTRMEERLELSPAQTNRVRAILRREAARRDSADGERPTREERRATRQSVRAEIDAVLTPAQRARAEELREERRAERGERGQRSQRGRGHGRR